MSTVKRNVKEASALIATKSLESVNDAVKILKEICSISQSYSDEVKIEALEQFFISEVTYEDGRDCISRWRDSLPFLRGEILQSALSLLVKVSGATRIPVHERALCASTLFERCYLDEGYNAFKSIAIDELAEWRYRVEGAKYLFASNEETNMEYAQEVLLSVIEDHEITSSNRYSIIVDFISRSGIKSFLNMSKIRVPYDEDFVFCMQEVFFNDEENDIRDRLLSGQHILQMTGIDVDVKETVCNAIVDIAANPKLEQRVRADAADIIVREGVTAEIRTTARKIISEIGGEDVASNSGLSGIKDVYADTENVHLFTDQVNEFIVSLVTSGRKVPEFSETYDQVVSELKSKITDRKQKFNALKALHRINIDTATFTEHKATLQEIFLHVWLRINDYEGEKLNVLKKRFFEELCDMSDTCSSGHSSRFINVLSTYDSSLSLKWEDQILSNIKGRLNAAIRKCEDEELKDMIVTAQTEMAETEDIEAYNAFIKKELPSLQAELESEFVGEGHISKAVFDAAFIEGTKNVFIEKSSD